GGIDRRDWWQVEGFDSVVAASKYISLCGVAPADSWNYRKDAHPATPRVGSRWHRCATRLRHRSAQSGILADEIWPTARARAGGDLRVGTCSHEANWSQRSPTKPPRSVITTCRAAVCPEKLRCRRPNAASLFLDPART